MFRDYLRGIYLAPHYNGNLEAEASSRARSSEYLRFLCVPLEPRSGPVVPDSCGWHTGAELRRTSVLFQVLGLFSRERAVIQLRYKEVEVMLRVE